MKVRFAQVMKVALLAVVCTYMFSSVPMSAAENSSRSKTKVQGVIVTRDGNLVKVQEKKSGSIREITITNSTQIEHDHAMGMKALIPGMNVKVKGLKNAAGEIEAKKVKLKPNSLSMAVAAQQEILDNKAAAGQAQASADEGIAKAGGAQTSADQAQNTANQGLTTAQSATTMATANAAGIGVLNERVSDLGNYNVVASSEVYFKNGSSRLSKDSQAALDAFIAANSNANGYVIEIDGYTSSTGSATYNQSLSDRRAAAVAEYLREKDNVVAWRVVAPAGYGKTHPAAANSTSKGRAENRRVEVKVLVSKGIAPNAVVTSAAN